MYGVIDIGSNTIRLVIYQIKDSTLVPMINKKYSVGLASYINGEGRLKSRGVDKAIAALLDFKEMMNYVKVSEVFAFATASLRNISNRDDVVDEIRRMTGFEVRVLTGDEEAKFDYYGVIHSVDEEDGLVVDVGGGSTEIIFFEDKNAVFSKSLPCGSLSLFKQHVDSIIPTKKEINSMRAAIRDILVSSKIPAKKYSSEAMLAVGGSARAVQKLLEDMDAPDSYEYPASTLDELLDILKKDSSALYRNILKSSADRIHTFTPGLVILNEIADYCNSETITTSKYGVREGYLYYILEEKGLL